MSAVWTPWYRNMRTLLTETMYGATGRYINKFSNSSRSGRSYTTQIHRKSHTTVALPLSDDTFRTSSSISFFNGELQKKTYIDW